jgi:hypothetical protein
MRRPSRSKYTVPSRVVTAEPNIFARVPFGSALTSKDIAGQNCLTAEFLNPAALCG